MELCIKMRSFPDAIGYSNSVWSGQVGSEIYSMTPETERVANFCVNVWACETGRCGGGSVTSVALEIEYEWHPEEIKHYFLFAFRVPTIPLVSYRATSVQFMKESNQGEYEKGRLPSVPSALQQLLPGTKEDDMSLIYRKTLPFAFSASSRPLEPFLNWSRISLWLYVLKRNRFTLDTVQGSVVCA